MASVTLKGNPIETVGELPATGSSAPDFTLVKNDLSEISLAGNSGKRIILNIFPSIDTGTCATSTKRFNEEAASLSNTAVICVSADLPFAMGRFCSAEGIENLEVGSVFRNAEFGDAYGVRFTTGPLKGLLSRAVVVIDENGTVIHTEQVSEIVDEPDYAAAISVL